MAFFMKRISTHVLDMNRGKPAQHVPVRLERQLQSGEWALITASHTDADGRCAQLLLDTTVLESGNYKLAFDTANYQSDNHVETLFPVIEITFRVRDGESQFHLPLLLSPHGYTTYRGS
jgi:5-hydroxyisourate hydrolase